MELLTGTPGNPSVPLHIESLWKVRVPQAKQSSTVTREHDGDGHQPRLLFLPSVPRRPHPPGEMKDEMKGISG